MLINKKFLINFTIPVGKKTMEKENTVNDSIMKKHTAPLPIYITK